MESWTRFRGSVRVSHFPNWTLNPEGPILLTAASSTSWKSAEVKAWISSYIHVNQLV